MKINTTTQSAVITIPDDIPCQNVLHKLQHTFMPLYGPADDVRTLARIQALMEQHPTFDIRTALTTVTQGYTYEYIVHCIQYTCYAQLEWIFEQRFVSPDYISRSGSPLILFAMQHCAGMFQYILSKGAKLIVDGDLVKNTEIPTIDTFYCAKGSQMILSTVFNKCILTRITNKDTIAKLIQLGRPLGRSDTQMREFHVMYGQDDMPIVHSDCLAPVRRRYILENTPCSKLMDVVERKQVDLLSMRAAGAECSPDDIRLCMTIALAADSLNVYRGLCACFPHCVQNE